MRYLFPTIIIMLCTFSESFAKDDTTPKTSLSSGDITSVIELERNFLRGKFKVDLVKKLISKSNAQNIRYGNKKKILNLRGISLAGKDLRNTIFNMANMISANLEEANLQASDLIHVDFTGANLRNADLRGADLSNAIFENTQLDGAKFDGANLFKASFVKTAIEDKNLLKRLKARTSSYVNLPREPLPEYYFED